MKLVGFRKKSCTGKTPTNSAGEEIEAGEFDNRDLDGRSRSYERQDDPEDSTTEDPLLAKEKQTSSQGGKVINFNDSLISYIHV